MADPDSHDPAEAPAGRRPSDHAYRHEQPEDWGWHAAWGRWSRVGAVVSIIALILLNFTWHYNNSADPWIWGMVAVLVLMLLRDRYRRKNAWRQ